MFYGLSFFKNKFFSTSENNSIAVVVLHSCKTLRILEPVLTVKESCSLSVEKFVCAGTCIQADVKLHRELRLAELHYKASAKFL